METISKIGKFVLFIVVGGMAIALILVLICAGVLASPIILLGYMWYAYLNYRYQVKKMNAKVELRSKKMISWS